MFVRFIIAYKNIICIKNINKKKEEPKEASGWDLTKHGFGAYLNSLGHTSKGIFEGYDKRDPNNPDAIRSFAERDKHLLTNMQGWYDSAKNNDLATPFNIIEFIQIYPIVLAISLL